MEIDRQHEDCEDGHVNRRRPSDASGVEPPGHRHVDELRQRVAGKAEQHGQACVEAQRQADPLVRCGQRRADGHADQRHDQRKSCT